MDTTDKKRAASPVSSTSCPALKVKKLSPNATTPTRATEGAAGYDLCASEDTVVPAGMRKIVRTDLSITIPPLHYGRIAPRSGLSWKQSIDIGAGVIDADYTGAIGMLVINNGSTDFVVKTGARVAQLLLERVSIPPVEVVEELAETVRGANGFGSTGKEALEATAASSES